MANKGIHEFLLFDPLIHKMSCPLFEVLTLKTSGFIDRSALPRYQGPYGKDIVEGKDGQDVWTCETGVLDGHVPNAIENLKNAFPIFAEGDFSKLVHFIRDHKLVPNVNRLVNL